MVAGVADGAGGYAGGAEPGGATVGRKNHQFAGSDGGAARWAVIASLIATAKLNEVEPCAYLKDVLEHMSNGHPMSRLDELLPWNWTLLAAAAA